MPADNRSRISFALGVFYILVLLIGAGFAYQNDLPGKLRIFGSNIFGEKTELITVQFRPASCLGSANRTNKAVGSAQLGAEAVVDDFTEGNSAILNKDNARLECTQFQTDREYVGSKLESITLHFSVAAKKIDDSPNNESETVDEEETQELDTQKDVEPVEEEPTDTPEPTSTPEVTDLPEPTEEPTPEPTQEPTSEPTVTVEPSPIATEEPDETTSESLSFQDGFLVAVIGGVEDEQENAQEATEEEIDILAEEVVIEEKIIDIPNLAYVEISSNGENWGGIGALGGLDLNSQTFSVPLMPTAELKTLQVAVNLYDTVEGYELYIDGMWFEVELEEKITLLDKDLKGDNEVSYYAQKCKGDWTNPGNAVGGPTAKYALEYIEQSDRLATVLSAGSGYVLCAGFSDDIFEDFDVDNVSIQIALAVVDSKVDAVDAAAGNLDPTIRAGDIVEKFYEDEFETYEPDPDPQTGDIEETASESQDVDVEIVEEESTASQSLDILLQIEEIIVEEEETQEPVIIEGIEFPVGDEASTSLEFFKEAEGGSISSVIADTLTALFGLENEDENVSLSNKDFDIDSQFYVSYTLDGDNWIVAGTISEYGDPRSAFKIPVKHASELSNIQVVISSVKPLSDTSTAYLHSIWLDVDYGRNFDKEKEELKRKIKRSKSNRTNSRNKPKLKLSDAESKHSCSVEPFAIQIDRGQAVLYSIKLNPSDPSLSYDLSTGYLPFGVDTVVNNSIDPDSPIAEGLVSFGTRHDTPPGSYSLVIIYDEVQRDGTILKSSCQLNLVIK